MSVAISQNNLPTSQGYAILTRLKMVLKTGLANFRSLIVMLLLPLLMGLAQPAMQAGVSAVITLYATPAHAFDCDNDGDPSDPDDQTECAGTNGSTPPTANAPGSTPPNNNPNGDQPPESPPPKGCEGGDPVDCYSGVFLHKRVDLYVKDVIPLSVERTYRSKDTLSRSFGVGTTLSYDLFVVTDYLSFVDIIQPDGSRIHFNCGSYTCVPMTSANSMYAGSILSAGLNFSVRLKNGTVMTFAGYIAPNTHSAGLQSITDRFGNTVTFTRDSAGNLTQATSPNGRHLNFTYDTSNRIKAVSDDANRQVTYTYNTNGTLQKVTDPLSNVESYTYDPTTLNMLAVTDKRSNVMVTNTYFAGTGNTALDGRVQKQTYADSSTTSFAYTFNTSTGNISYTDVTDERKMVRRSVFDTLGYTTAVTHALGTAQQQAVTMVRDPQTHLVTQQTDSLGRVTTFIYDQNGNVTNRIDLSGTAQATSWNYAWDTSFNNLTSSTDPLGHATNYQYDSLGNLIETDDALGHKATQTYFTNGQLQSISRYPSVSSPNTAITTNFTYQNGDLATVTDPKGRTTTFNVDVLGRVIGTQDPAGQLWTTNYDNLDRITQRCDPTAACATMQYDPNNNLTQFIKGATQRNFTYDSRNRPLTEGRATTVERTFAYPVDYLHTTLTEATGRTVTSTLDILGRNSHVVMSTGGTTPSQRTLDYTWDTESRLQSLVDNSTGTLSYTYDNRFDTIASETSSTGNLTYTYYANGQRATATPSNGSTISYQYDNANRLYNLSQAAGTGTALPSTALTVGLAYDNANRRQTVTLPNGISQGYGWDDADELTNLTWSKSGTAVGDLTYNYNNLGQRIGITGAFARLLASTPETLTIGTDGRVATENGTTIIHDANGHLTQDTQYKYVWNELGKLANVYNLSNNALRATYQYDPLGRRISKTIDGVTTKFLYDGNNPIQLQNASGTSTENLLAGGIDEWMARTTGGQTQTYLSDALGSTLRLTDNQGNKLVDYTYDAYGATTNDSATNTNQFQYTGRENDGIHYYYRARFYKPTWGRFISQDPIGLGGGDNLYAYVNGSPVSYRDPFGHNALAGAEFGAEAGSFAGPVGTVVGGLIGAGVGAWLANEAGNWIAQGSGDADRPPPGSKPIDETPWSGDHKDIKDGVGAGARDNVKISPDGEVWVENPDGSWSNHGDAADYTGSGRSSGRRGKDRNKGRCD